MSLEDGKFNEERAQLLDKDFVSVRRGRQRMGRHFTDAEVSIEQSDCIYIMSYRLPLTCNYNPATKEYNFEWLTFVADNMNQETKNSKVMSSTRHSPAIFLGPRGRIVSSSAPGLRGLL